VSPASSAGLTPVGKRHNTTDTTDFCPRQLVADLLRGNWCNGFWPLHRIFVRFLDRRIRETVRWRLFGARINAVLDYRGDISRITHKTNATNELSLARTVINSSSTKHYRFIQQNALRSLFPYGTVHVGLSFFSRSYCTIGYWHHNVVCLSVCVSVSL